jgi:alkanesulfonate monooxygenase SsuD/methylene tetrahydromethanopterin reductase-like flavin-dependent oxidoreductase (luciferase family)
VKLGLHYWNYSTPADPARIATTLGGTARVAEQAGFSGFSVMDHYFQMHMEGVRFLAATERYAALGVTDLEVMPDRHPVEFAEQVAERVLPRLANL